MTKYYCLNCGWEGEDIIEWEEKPRDEFWYKCPKCHRTDINVMRFDGEVWIPAIIFKEPKEIEQRKRFYARLSEMMMPDIKFLNSVTKEKVMK